MNGLTNFALLILVFFSFLQLKAQNQAFNALILKKLDQGLGLSETSNALFYEDNKNNIWISSVDGLNKFDGNKVVVYRPRLNKKNKIFSNSINSKVFMAPSGRFLFSTPDGLHSISPDFSHVKSWQIPDPLTHKTLDEIQLIQCDSQGVLWLTSDSKLYSFDDRSGRIRIKVIGSFPKFSQRYLFLKKKKAPYFSIVSIGQMTDTLHIVEIDQAASVCKISNLKIGQQKKSILNAVLEADSIAWIICTNGLYKYDLKNLKPVNTQPYRPHSGIDTTTTFVDLISYDERYLWIITYEKGLFVFDKRQSTFVKHYTHGYLEGQKISFNRLDKIFKGKDGTIWLANWEMGLYYFNPKLIKFNSIFLDRADGSSSKVAVSSLATRNKNEIYFAIPNHGAFSATKVNENWEINPLTKEIPGCKELILLNAQTLILADTKSIFLYKLKTNKLEKIYSSSTNLKKLILLNDLQYLLVRTDKALFTFNLRSRLIVPNPFPEIKNLNTVQVRNKLLFFNCSSDSLMIFEQRGSGYQLLEKLSGIGRVNHISESREKNIYWIASSQGLIKLDLNLKKKKLSYLSDKTSSLEQSFNAVLEDLTGNLWLASNSGIIKCTIQNTSVKVNRFTENDGVLNYQFSEGVAARVGDRLFFGGPKGTHTVDVLEATLDKRIPKICLQEIDVNGLKLNEGGNLCDLEHYTFLPKQRNITFKFSTSDFVGIKENLFQYRISRSNFFDKSTKWVNVDANGVINLAGLNKGYYTIELIVSNSDGVWMDKKNPRRINFQIKPYWYETTLFYIFLLALFIITTYFVYRNRLRRIQERANLTDTELKVLRLQMNPHFIYNCLAAIQGYVLKQNIDKANGLISSFSKLMRRVLTESVKSYLTLGEEIELLESYLKTESIRFEDQLNYRFEVDPSLDSDEILIPSMILQPFVENAIVHGFNKKTKSSLIKIAFQPQKNMLKCTVEDNGAGLGTSVNSMQHQSKAIEITTKRLELISLKRNEPASLRIINLVEEDPSLTGVRVEILLPLNF